MLLEIATCMIGSMFTVCDSAISLPSAQVFASVQRLAEAFIALYTAGNPLFRQWEAHVKCNSSAAEPSIVMDFNLGSVVSVIFVDGVVEEQLPELCKKMEKCFDYWMDFVNKQRSHHYYLNYYTAEQIVYLCSKLTRAPRALSLTHTHHKLTGHA